MIFPKLQNFLNIFFVIFYCAGAQKEKHHKKDIFCVINYLYYALFSPLM